MGRLDRREGNRLKRRWKLEAGKRGRKARSPKREARRRKPEAGRAQPRRATIAAATVADAHALAELDARCFPEADRFPLRVWRHLLGPSARRGSALTLVARAGGEVVGAINGLLRANSRVVRIYTIAVDPAARGQGLGERLMRALAIAARPRCDELSLEVRADNPARALYEKLGMRVASSLRGYYDDGADGVRYRAPLSAIAAR